MLMRVVWRGVKPNDLTTMLAKLWEPPLGIWVRSSMAKMNHVLGSTRHSLTCSHFQCVFSVLPVPAVMTLFAATFLSSGVRNLAWEIVSGRKKNMGIVHRKVARPRMRYIHLHGRPPPCPTPNASKLDINPPTEFPANQMPTLVGISSRVYHVDVKNMKPGVIVASATPSRKRITIRPWKL